MPDNLASPPLLAADFDYFRLPRHKWEFMLTRLCQLGVNAVTVSVVWRWHQTAPKTIDLNGTTDARRDLTGLLRLCQTFNLPCLLNLGPFCHQGVLTNGLPPWVVEETGLFEASLHPVAEAWLKTIGPELAAYQTPDGSIAALVLNNQPADPPPDRLSDAITRVRWPVWLRQQYSSLDALNAAYQAGYTSFSRVDFPADWPTGDHPAARDARNFLHDLQQTTLTRYAKILTEAGWQGPLYPSEQTPPAGHPPITPCSLTDPATLPQRPSGIVRLQHPIQADPDTPELGQGPVWAGQAPIESDGSLKPAFYQARLRLWPARYPTAASLNGMLSIAGEECITLTAASDTSFKISVSAEKRWTAWRLLADGTVQPAPDVKQRGKTIRGPYRQADTAGQTDLYLLTTGPDAALSSPARQHLTALLTGQLAALERCSQQAERLAQSLTPSGPATGTRPSPQAGDAPITRTLAEARRGLQEADQALRRATQAISGLEEGLAAILGQHAPETGLAAASAPAVLLPDSLTADQQEILRRAAQVCRDISPPLAQAAANLRPLLQAGPFTLVQYRQASESAVAAARSASAPLVEMITLLRGSISARQLPFVFWYVHNRLLELFQTLRWGVIRKKGQSR